MEILDHRIVVGIVLEAAAGIDHPGHAQPVHLTHEMPGGVLLIGGWQLGALGQRGVEDRRIRPRQQQPGGIAGGIAHNLAAGWVGRVLGVTHRPQRRRIQQCAVIEVEDEHRRIRRHSVQLGQRRQTLFGELVLGKAADHAHPVRAGRTRDLRGEQRHRIAQRRHPVPAQFEVIVQPATDDVHVAVDQAGDRAQALAVDHGGIGGGGCADFGLAAHGGEAAIAHQHGLRLGIGAIERGDARVDDQEISR